MRQSQTATALLQSEALKREKNEFIFEVGKFFLDLAKLTFAGVFLTAIMDISIDMVKVIQWCSIVILGTTVLGFIFIKVGTNK